MTAHYAVFGNPIAHSLSPQIHTFFAAQTKQDLDYGAKLVEPGSFHTVIQEFFDPQCGNGSGCNITVPCKLDAYNFASELSSYAEAAGAVNTLQRLEDGRVLGDNTDGRGLVLDLQRLSLHLAGRRVLIVGAGGAARGIILPLLEQRVEELTIVNRTAQKAFELCQLFERRLPEDFSGTLNATTLEGVKGAYDLIINATSLSLKGQGLPLQDEVIAQSGAVYDLMYKLNENTATQAQARALGVKKAYGGFGMLLMQAALSFELWRGVLPDVDAALEHFSCRS